MSAKPTWHQFFLAVAWSLVAAHAIAAQPLPTYVLAPDTSTRPQDDFYNYVNGTWTKATQIPPEYPWYGTYVAIYDANQAILQKIVDQSLKRTIGKVQDAGEIRISALYSSFMDEPGIEAQGLEPLEDILRLIRRIDSSASLARVWGLLAANHYSLEPSDRMVATNPFSIEFWPNDRNPKEWSPFLYPSGLGLPGTSYYTPQDQSGQDLLSKYHAHIGAITAAANSQYSDSRIAAVVGLETHLAACQSDTTQGENPEKRFHPMNLAKLNEQAPAFDWASFMSAVGLPKKTVVIVRDYEYISCINTLLGTTSFREWQDYLRWQVLRLYSPYLPKRFERPDFDFYLHTLLGSDTPIDRKRRALTLLGNSVPNDLGRLYVAGYFDVAAKRKVTQMAEFMRAAYISRIDSNSWFDAKTRDEAKHKMRELQINVGYPDSWDRASVNFHVYQLIGNIRNAQSVKFRMSVSRLDAAVDRRTWLANVYDSGSI